MTELAKSGARSEQKRLITAGRPAVPLFKRIQIPIIVGAALALEHSLGPTMRFDTMGLQHYQRTQTDGRPFILAFWHRSIFLSTWWWRNRGIVAMTSANFDGQLIARVLERMGCTTVPGSSTRGGMRGLALLAQRVSKGGNAAFAVDGPRGPRYVAKPGPVLLARRTGCPILCYHIHAEHGHAFEKSWDQFQIPYPFSRVALVMGPPIEVQRDANPETLERKQSEMQTMLERVRDAAEGWFRMTAADRERERALWNG